MWRKLFSKIQYKLIILFSLFCMAIFSVSGVLHYYYTEDSLDEELGRKLLAVAQAATLQIRPEFVSALRAGDEGGRSYAYYQKRLEELRQATDVERIYILDTAGRSLLDTREEVPVATAYPQLEMNRFEFERTLEGLPSHTVLFESYDGKLCKTAFVPMTVRNEIRGVIAVDGSATFLYLIKQIEFHLVSVGVIGVIISILIGYYFARTISTPVKHLVQAATRIGDGKLEKPIRVRSGDEVGFLGKTMEAMRANILKRDQYLKTMLAGVAHELRNPLGGMEIYAHLMQRSAGDEVGKKQIGKIIHEIDMMKKILSDFQEFARPRTATITACDVEKTVNGVWELLTKEIAEKAIVFDKKIRHPHIDADPGHLRQILVNVLENAIQASPQGGRIHVECVRIGEEAILRITDEGEGVDAEVMEKIFDPFFTTKEKGSGLGLAIVKMLAELNGGQVDLQSERGRGTTCTLTFRHPAKTRMPE